MVAVFGAGGEVSFSITDVGVVACMISAYVGDGSFPVAGLCSWIFVGLLSWVSSTMLDTIVDATLTMCTIELCRSGAPSISAACFLDEHSALSGIVGWSWQGSTAVLCFVLPLLPPRWRVLAARLVLYGSFLGQCRTWWSVARYRPHWLGRPLNSSSYSASPSPSSLGTTIRWGKLLTSWTKRRILGPRSFAL